MERRRHERESKAFHFLRQRTDASAFEIGAAAIRGERCAQRIGWRGKAAIGLAIAAKCDAALRCRREQSLCGAGGQGRGGKNRCSLTDYLTL